MYYFFLKNILYTLIVDIKSGSCLVIEQFSFLRIKYFAFALVFYCYARAYLSTLRCLRVFALSFDWFTRLSMPL